MGPIVYFFFSGTAFFAAAGLLLATTLLPARGARKALGIASRSITILGVAVVVLSSTPLPIWLYALWGMAMLAWVIAQVGSPHLPGRTILAARLPAALLCVVAVGVEAPWHVARPVELPASRNVYVVGDSLSAGLEPAKRKPWPEVMGQRYDLNVFNLAIAGATAASAAEQAPRIGGGDAVVILAIGGNDLLGRTAVQDFEVDLGQLIEQVRAPGRRLIMFELPLPPMRQRYGLVQRRLAKANDVVLIPKRFLAKILTTPGATVDGIHLSEVGHRMMADLVGSLLRAAEAGAKQQ